ncbi:glycosyltransferase [Hanamia caeni]|uniref:Glycosyltransferase n=1 Tax=Hanamia caeni TaxID=2294116 RepID=A0A3M9N345_9BACT|nr:glycosyltransferase family 2 protein [Hanamia caeni]RNI32179.1 glycosyltransferase [Hanamia caeni]
MNSNISLCIPAYNASHFLPALFESIRKQQPAFHEVLLYDDCSTDDTAIIAESHGAKVIRGESNRGCSFGKNQLAMQVTSAWIFFLDTDDMLYPNFTKVIRQFISENVFSEMIIVGYDYVDYNSGNLLSKSKLPTSDLKEDPVKFMINNKIVNSSVIKKDAFNKIGGFDLDINSLYIEDRAFSIKAAMKGIKIEMCKEVIFRINYFPESMSAKNPSKWIEAAIYLFEKVNNETGQRYSKEISYQLFQNASWAAKYSLWNLVKRSIDVALALSPDLKPGGSKIFQILFKISPYYAFLVRNKLMSKIKPQFNE